MISEKLKSLKSKLWLQFDPATWLCLYFQEKWTESTDEDGNSKYFFLRRTHTFRWSLECCFLYLSLYFTKLNFLLY